MNENSFTTWWENNKGSDDLRERYDNCMQDMREIDPNFKQTYRQWGKELWKEEQEEGL